MRSLLSFEDKVAGVVVPSKLLQKDSKFFLYFSIRSSELAGLEPLYRCCVDFSELRFSYAME